MWAWSKVVGGCENSGAYTGALPHCTMPDKISVSPNESLCYQLWNPNKVSNTGNYTRIAWYTSDGTYIKSDELPRLDGGRILLSNIYSPIKCLLCHVVDDDCTQ